MVRYAQGDAVPSLVISAGRLSIASIVLTFPVLQRYRADLARLTWRKVALGVLSGLFLAIHFATWISSLEYTTVAASVVLVSTAPLFVALLSIPFLGERVSRRVLVGISLAFVGSIIVALADDAGKAPARSAPLLGAALAVAGAATVALYMIIGRKLRARLPVLPYIWLVYSSAAVALDLAVIVQDQPVTGYSTKSYLAILALGLVPQLIGHSSFNYALGHLPAAYVSLIVLGEPVGSALLAWLILEEIPSRLVLAGSVLILAGIGAAAGGSASGADG